jgi:2-polyprenyl-6-hydroxyphenyl methylase/3-demethylubiquinone-9 3-methyltransferase
VQQDIALTCEDRRMTPKITPFIWYDADPLEVRDFYASVFDDVSPGEPMRSDSETPVGVTVQLGGRDYILFNGGSSATHTHAFSLMIYTEDQEETDYYWNALVADGGEENVCGWLRDKYGVHWQVTPRMLMEVLSSSDSEARERAYQAMLKMKKIVIADIQAAYDGG